MFPASHIFPTALLQAKPAQPSVSPPPPSFRRCSKSYINQETRAEPWLLRCLHSLPKVKVLRALGKPPWREQRQQLVTGHNSESSVPDPGSEMHGASRGIMTNNSGGCSSRGAHGK